MLIILAILHLAVFEAITVPVCKVLLRTTLSSLPLRTQISPASYKSKEKRFGNEHIHTKIPSKELRGTVSIYNIDSSRLSSSRERQLQNYDAVNLVSHSVEIRRPVLVVSFNNWFGLGGFLASLQIAAELKKDGFSGKWKFRAHGPTTYEWVGSEIHYSIWRGYDYVSAFGHSAGAISIGHHFAATAFCISGLGSTLLCLSPEEHQAIFDATCRFFSIDEKYPDALDQLRIIPEQSVSRQCGCYHSGRGFWNLESLFRWVVLCAWSAGCHRDTSVALIIPFRRRPRWRTDLWDKDPERHISISARNSSQPSSRRHLR